MALTLIKLGYLIIKSAARPMSSLVKRFAIRSFLFRRACLLAAQKFHVMEVKMRQTIQTNKKHSLIRPLEENKAIEIGGMDIYSD